VSGQEQENCNFSPFLVEHVDHGECPRICPGIMIDPRFGCLETHPLVSPVLPLSHAEASCLYGKIIIIIGNRACKDVAVECLDVLIFLSL